MKIYEFADRGMKGFLSGDISYQMIKATKETIEKYIIEIEALDKTDVFELQITRDTIAPILLFNQISIRNSTLDPVKIIEGECVPGTYVMIWSVIETQEFFCNSSGTFNFGAVLTHADGRTPGVSVQASGAAGIVVRGFNSDGFPAIEVQNNPGSLMVGLYPSGNILGIGLTITGSAGATSTTSGAVRITGGVGVGGGSIGVGDGRNNLWAD